MRNKIALIKDGVVVNCIIAEPIAMANYIKSGKYDEVVNINFYNVGKGDSFSGGCFYRDGVEIKKNKTEDEKRREIGIAVTNSDIENIILGQYCTDLEIRIIALGG